MKGEAFTAHYYAVPAWRLNCLYVSDAQAELPDLGGEDVFECDSLEYVTLVIDAQTGKMQDYTSTEKDRAYYKGFTPWDKASGK